MVRRINLVLVALLFVHAVARADAITFDTEADYLLGLASRQLVIGAEGWDDAPFADGDQIANGSKINGIQYDSQTTLFHNSVTRSNIVTDRYGSRSPENALGLSFFGYEAPFSRLDAITFRFDHAINAFGISFATQGSPGNGTYGFYTNNGYSATSSPDPFLGTEGDEPMGQFAGLYGPESFTEVTVFVEQPYQWENLSFVLDNLIVGRKQSGAISVAVPTAGGAIGPGSDLSFLIFGTPPAGGEPGGTFPAIQWIIPDAFDPFLSTSLSEGDSAVVLGIIEAQFGSPHIYTGDIENVAPDVQQALVAAWADIQLGMDGTFHAFLADRGIVIPPEVYNFGEPGSVLEGVPVAVYLDFVESYNPNTNPDGSAMDPSFRFRLDETYFAAANQVQFSSAGLEEIIYPHPDGVQISTLVVIPFGGIDPNTGLPTLDAAGAIASPVPEPGTLVTLGLVLLAGAVVYRRRRAA